MISCYLVFWLSTIAEDTRMSEMVQQVNILAIKSNDLSLILRTHMVKGETLGNFLMMAPHILS